MAKIYIDAGHGGSDPGAVGNGLYEKNLTLDISKKIKEYLDKHYTGHTVKLSRSGDKTLSLKSRTNDANNYKADLLLSIHINAGGGTGFESFIHSGTVSKNTFIYRDAIHDSVMKEIGDVRDRGKKRANFHMLRESRMPAVLTEILFIDTKSDADKLKDSNFISKVVKGHAEGIAKALGLKKKGSPKSNQKAPTPKETAPKKTAPKETAPKKTTPKKATSNVTKVSTPYVGKRVESKYNGNLRFYKKPSWEDKDVMGYVKKGYGFPKIVAKYKVGNGYQYEVQNSKGATYFITASSKYVVVK